MAQETQQKIRFATIWLAGCSGCHMSFLDLDEFLIELTKYVDVVFSPIGSDVKDYPENVDVCLIEGAVANQENLELLEKVRQNTKLLIAFGDCAVTTNVTGIRNQKGDAQTILERGYKELTEEHQLPQQITGGILPPLLPRVLPIHEVVDIDLFLPGCPPDADRIKAAIAPLLEGKLPEMEGREMIKFG
ncbi:oxidoreductase [Picosynechococcus sp. PCC 8807]|uniref:NADH-quinone oxidoreductase subunit B family protein n=1 Tax=Picosynechococcus sp. PCC 8807 TaxID=195248 RepID=UPI000810C65C|nr:oxidoreductase [Picosynechococcus sp. PCC 8807]ANV89355.1 oxidoreductase [Picosynechococcus sp. PCC 8807]